MDSKSFYEQLEKFKELSLIDKEKIILKRLKVLSATSKMYCDSIKAENAIKLIGLLHIISYRKTNLPYNMRLTIDTTVPTILSQLGKSINSNIPDIIRIPRRKFNILPTEVLRLNLSIKNYRVKSTDLQLSHYDRM